MMFVTPPFFLRWIYPGVTWHRSRKEKHVYLTFDDGPIPDVTPWVLDTLAQYNAKATFFCVGENIEKHPELFQRTIAEGHQVGNHTHNHLKGWDHLDRVYYENIARCNALTKTRLFRPPYMRASRKQIKHLRKTYELVYFDVLSYDFDPKVTPEQCLQNVMKNIQNGSIIVFHDNIKAIPRLQYTLPRVLEKLSEQGYLFFTL